MSHAQRTRRRRRSSGGGSSKAFLAFMVLGIVVVIAGLAGVGYVVHIAASAPPLSSLKARAIARELARLRGRRHLARLHPERRAAPAAQALGHPAGRARRDHRDRGRALLQAQRRRLRGRRPRGGQEPAVRQDAGRLDDHHAARPLALHLQRADLHAQDPRGQARRGARGRARQGVDPREVPGLDPLRHRRRPVRDRHQGRGEDLLLQGARGAQPARGRAARRHPPGHGHLLAGAQPGRGQDRRNEVLAKMAELGWSARSRPTPPRARAWA